MKAAHEYGLMSLGILVSFIIDIATETYALIMFPIIIPVFVLCVIGTILLWDEPGTVNYTEKR